MKKEAWLDHYNACLRSGMSKMAYAKQHNISYCQLLYWVRKFESTDASPTEKEKQDFVPVKFSPTISQPEGNSLGMLEFTNGAKLHIYDVSMLSVISGLAGLSR